MHVLTRRTVVELFTLLLERTLTAPEGVAHGAEGYYFAENGEYLQRDLITTLAKTLYALGAIESAEPAKFVTDEEVVAGALKVRPLQLQRRCQWKVCARGSGCSCCMTF